jgi:hypothetical protein
MPRPCTICTHANRDAIDRALIAGAQYTAIAREYRASEDAVSRHRESHLPERLASAVRPSSAEDVVEATDLLTELRLLRAKANAILLQAEAAGDHKTALMGIREARACLELLAELEGELDRRPTVNLVLAPEWLALRGRIVAALSRHPAARADVIHALEAGT